MNSSILLRIRKKKLNKLTVATATIKKIKAFLKVINKNLKKIIFNKIIKDLIIDIMKIDKIITKKDQIIIMIVMIIMIIKTITIKMKELHIPDKTNINNNILKEMKKETTIRNKKILINIINNNNNQKKQKMS